MGLTTADFDFVRVFVSARAGIVLEAGKEYLVESRLRPLAIRHGFASIADFVAALRRTQNRDHERQLLEAMTTNETTFFRDVAPFDALREQVLPGLIAARRSSRQLNVWCAASSTGQEPYSVAMLLAEHFPELTTWKVNFVATDLSEEVLDRARSGVYSQLEVNRGLPVSYLVKYFERHGTSWQIRDDIRQRVEFRQMNLIKPWPAFPQFDLVFIRNVMIYFDVETKRSILSRIRQLLRPDGHLFLGAAETALNLDPSFVRTDYVRAGCYRLAA